MKSEMQGEEEDSSQQGQRQQVGVMHEVMFRYLLVQNPSYQAFTIYYYISSFMIKISTVSMGIPSPQFFLFTCGLSENYVSLLIS